MAIYHLTSKVAGRAQGRSAVASAAYRSGEKLEDRELGRVFNYLNRDHVIHSEIMVPDHAPDWMKERAELWNGVHAAEKRKDSQLYREVELALPRELSVEQNRELLRGFVQTEFVNRGMVADVALHQTDNDNPHAHVMLTMRDIEGDGFGPKNRGWNSKQLLQGWREAWENHSNDALDAAGSAARIDHRTLEAQGVERIPTQHLGVAVCALEEKGQLTRVGNAHRSTVTLNEHTARAAALPRVTSGNGDSGDDYASYQAGIGRAQKLRGLVQSATDTAREQSQLVKGWAERLRHEETTGLSH